MDREGESCKSNEMEMREGKDDVASNVMVEAILLALADPLLGSLVAQLVPPVPTLLDKAPSIVAFLLKEQQVIS